MARKNWNRWFFASRRGQIITLLRRSSRTVDELAQALGLTHTAVRAHLAALERDGLVQQHSERRGGGKPSSVYDLTEASEYLFPKAYAQLLDQLLDVLQGRMTTEEIKTLLREIGRRMAAEWKLPPGNLRVRLEAAVEVLNELGGLMERETEGEALCIRGYRCPFAAVVQEHPEVCDLAETLLSELMGGARSGTLRTNWSRAMSLRRTRELVAPSSIMKAGKLVFSPVFQLIISLFILNVICMVSC